MTIESDRLAWERAAIAWGQENLVAVVGRAVRRLPAGQAALSIRHLLDDEELALVALLLYDARVISDLGGRAAAVEQTAQEIRAAGARAVGALAFDPGQARDEDGKWADGGGVAVHGGTTPGQPHVTETPEFKKWFGDSKVVNAAGNPLVVYHGTREDFRSFAPSHAGGGMYFTTNPDLAGAYSLKYGKSKVDAEFTSLRAKLESEGVSKWEVHQQPEWKALEDRARVEGASVVPVHLSIRRPYEMRGDVDSDRVNAIKDSPAEIAKLKAKGYDGIVVRNALDRPNVPYSKADAAMAAKRADLWVAFEPTQVKSAIGNRGTFDPKNPDLRLAAPVYPVAPEDAFAVEPKDAIQYFRNLAPGTVLPKGFEAKHRRTAFSLAVTTDETLLKRVHEVLLQKLQTGERKAEAWDFKQTMDDLGLSTRNPQYAEMVLRTNAMDAYNDGYERQVRDDPAIRDEFPYWEYLGIDDDRMGEDHRVNLTGGVNGTAYYPADRTFDEVRGDRPFNCRCGQRWVHTSEAEAEGLPVGGAE